ncbi:MAG: Fur family transcriptional regulator [Proteobacteria bacterium]|nr:Fur family transcriptional regulator [Pseudomonadota bacterium]
MAASGLPSRHAWSNAHDHQRCIDDAVTAAEKLCHKRGTRLTEIRRRVLELVWENHQPAGAYALLDGLKPAHPAAAPPTIYRALEFLLEHGLVHRIQSLNAFVGCADPEHAHRGLFLICDACGDAVEIEDSGIDRAMQKSAARVGFTLKSRTIEAVGRCPQCAAV